MLWREIVKKLPKLLKKLERSAILNRDELFDCPRTGVYVFYDRGKPIYAGRSNNLKERILSHSRPSSGHYSASLAFKMARDTNEKWKNCGATRKELCGIEGFTATFSAQKMNVAKFKVRCVEITSDVLQLVFEIYASMELDTKYNDWRTT